MSDKLPPLHGVLESALYVADLETSHRFYERVFGFRELLKDPDRLHALSVSGKQVLLLFRAGASTTWKEVPGGSIPPHDGRGKLHLAFAISKDDAGTWRERLQALGVPILSEVSFPNGGRSIYFHDPDGHVLELVTPGVWDIY